MAKFKLKIEEKEYIDAAKDIFCSFNKSGVASKYMKLEDDQDSFDFSYGLLTYDLSQLEMNNFEFEKDKTLLLQEIYVEDKKRGKGFGKELLSQMIEFAKSKGIKEIFLNASSEWKKTPFEVLKAFYSSFGFTQIGETKYFKVSLN